MSEWIDWCGEERCPVPDGTLIDVEYRGGWTRFGVPANESDGLVSDGRYDTTPVYWCGDGGSCSIVRYRVCEPDDVDQPDGGWIDWPGGECPVPRGTLVDVEYQDGVVAEGIPAGEYHDRAGTRLAMAWAEEIGSGTIVRYRLANGGETMAHVHAEHMKAYAEDAAETNKPWERWERRPLGNPSDGDWITMDDHPMWSERFEYRRKPAKPLYIFINGEAVPQPLREAPELGERYWLADPGRGATRMTWNNTQPEKEWLKAGMIHLDRDAALRHSASITAANNAEGRPL